MKNEDRAESCICSYGAGVLNGHRIAFKAEIDGVRNGNDIEFIHRMRVATRRLRCALPIFSFCFPKKKVSTWLKQIKQITRALGASRDTDVQISVLQQVIADTAELRCHPGLRRLSLRLIQSRALMQNDIYIALDKLIQSNILQEMDDEFLPLATPYPSGVPYPNDLYQLSARFIQDRLLKMLSYESYIQTPEYIEELHAMRIAAKWLRYSMEIFSALYADQLKIFLSAVKQYQEMLGNIHDCDVWDEYIPRFIEEERERIQLFYGHTNPIKPLLPGLNYFRQNRQMSRRVEYANFLKEWNRRQAKGLWRNLQRILEQPLIDKENMYPPLGAIGFLEENLVQNNGQRQAHDVSSSDSSGSR